MLGRVLKIAVPAVLSVVLAFASVTPVMADTPYQGYTYDFWGNLIPSPAAYIPSMTFGGSSIKDPRTGEAVGRFNSPQDIKVDKNNLIYVADTGNNRIVVFDLYLRLDRVIDGFEMDGEWETFNRPNGIFIDDNLDIYIADTENKRIVRLTKDGEFVSLVKEPKFETLADDFTFLPLKVCVDKSGRVYAIVRNVYEGIMQFDEQGNFFSYFGTVEVRFSAADLFWRTFSTPEQRARQAMFIPTEFASMDIDEFGFIYATNVDTNETANKVKRLNPKGQDVLLNFNERVRINGDQRYALTGPLSGQSTFIGVVARESGMYSVLDSARNRVYTYDSEGNLLYIIGGTGSVMGMSRMPSAIETIGDKIMVLDSIRAQIVYFEPTEYGRLINEAIELRYGGNEAAAVENWEKVLQLDENYILAYSGIGKAYLARGENVKAMDYLKKGMDMQYYSVAFKRYRNDVLTQSLSYVLTAGVVVAAALVGFRIYKRKKRGNEE